jgi:predicted secreted acid phosphatase
LLVILAFAKFMPQNRIGVVMKYKILFASLFAGCFLLQPAVCAPVQNEVKNLDFFKGRAIEYHDSGRYDKEVMAVDDKAFEYLRGRIANASPKEKLAVVLDIDETALSNYKDMVQMGFGGTLKQINDAENQGADAAILPTLALYQYAKAHHVAVFFITGRTGDYRPATVSNLEAAGFKDFDGLTMKPDDYELSSVIPYKTAARRAIQDKGFTIVLSVGDQFSDLAGGFAERTFKLPNPFYYIA